MNRFLDVSNSKAATSAPGQTYLQYVFVLGTILYIIRNITSIRTKDIPWRMIYPMLSITNPTTGRSRPGSSWAVLTIAALDIEIGNMMPTLITMRICLGLPI